MKVVKRIGVFALVVLGASALAGVYRALIDGAPFFSSFDGVLTVVVAELWKMLNTPAILTILVVGYFLEVTRDYWMRRLGEVLVVEIGSNLRVQFRDIGKRAQAGEASVKQASPEVIEALVESLDITSVKFLLSVANKWLPFEQLIQMLVSATKNLWTPAERGDVNTRGYYSIRFATNHLWSVLYYFRALFKKIDFESRDEVWIGVSPEVKALLQAKVDSEPEAST